MLGCPIEKCVANEQDSRENSKNIPIRPLQKPPYIKNLVKTRMVHVANEKYSHEISKNIPLDPSKNHPHYEFG